MTSSRQPWWRGGVLYQIYPRSFADSSGDGVGDLAGIRARLDHLEWLGVDGVWLNPTFPSPNKDWGYDVADYCSVHPELGTLDELDALVRDAGERGIRILLDLVPAHSSDRHEWFVDSRSSRESARRDWYIWRDQASDQDSVFGGKAWTFDERTGQYYHHLFLPEQPDLNWMNQDVRSAFEEILRFWFARGIEGFRVDVVHELVKDPPEQANRPEVHRVLRHWRSLADSYDPQRVLLGETWVLELEELATFYGNGTDELNLAFNFPFVFAGLDAGERAELVARTEEVLPVGAWPVWALGNHDTARFPTRLCEEDDGKVKAALLFLLTLRGTAVLYYGEELGMRQVEIPPERVLDVDGRDGARTPMPWGDVEWRDAWLPLGGNTRTVEEQRDDPDSVLNFTRRLIELRQSRDDLLQGSYERLEAPPGVWAWRRGERTAVAVNLSDRPVQLSLRGDVLLATDGNDEVAELAPWAGVVLGYEPEGE
jgi:alpha-glucosidase